MSVSQPHVGPVGSGGGHASAPGTISTILAITQREFASYFVSPIAYICMAVFLFVGGLAFSLTTFRTGGEASLRATVDVWILIDLFVVVSLLTMRMLSEEIRGGTIESLMTAPVTETAVVLGKFLGAFGLLLVMLGAMLIYPVILASFGSVDVRLLACHYVGLVLVGMFYVSVALFFSACTRHQVVAGLAAIVVLAMMTFAFEGLAQVVEGLPRTLLQHLSVQSHFRDFVRGLVDVNHLAYFGTTTLAFLFMTVKVLEFRRWR